MEDDDSIYNLSESNPLMIELRAVQKAQADLESYIEKRKKKMTPQEQAMKSSLQKKLLT